MVVRAANLQEQSALLIAAQKQEMEALQRVSEQEAQMAPLQHSLTRVRAELDSGKQHTEWLETQLAEKTAAVQELRQTAAKHAHEHEEVKVELTEDLASARRQLENLRLSQKKLDSALIHSKEQLKELQASKLHSEEQFESELNAQRRLAELYKQSAADANSRITELQELTDSLRKSLAESEQALSLETERSKQQVEHLFREQAETSERLVGSLQEELREAKERISELEKNKMRALENAAAIGDLSSAAGEAHLAANGLSAKQMVDNIVELEKSLQDERAEKEKLQLYMDRIVKEVQEKTPIIMGLRLDHERAIESHTVLSERFEVCKQELTKSRAKEAQAWKEKQTYEKKCESLAQSVDDLSRQVQHLLFRSQEHQQPQTMRPGEVASENLVVFKDIEELQMRNQQLLTVIRELTEMTKRKHNDGSESESDMGSASSAHLIISADSDDESAEISASGSTKHRLASARKELEQLRAEREEDREMITAIIKQRDMYRVLLAQADRQYMDGSAPSQSDGVLRLGNGNDSLAADAGRLGDPNDKRMLRELQREFDDYKKEKQANMKLLNESLDQARADCSQAKVTMMQAQVESAHHKERFEALDSRYQDAEKEIVRLRAKTDQLSSLLLQHQQSLSDSEAKLETAMSQLQSLRVEKAGALREAEFLRKHEEKMQSEMKTLRLDNTNLLKLMEAGRKMDATREQRDAHEIEAQTRKVASLEARLHEQYDKLDAREAIAGANVLAAEKEKQAVAKDLEKLQKLHSEVKEQVARLEEQKTSLEDKLAILEKENTHLREQLRKGTSAAAAERVATLEMQLRDAQREVQASLVARKSLADTATKYKAVAEANEKSLAELSSASEQWKQVEQAKLEGVEKQRDHIQLELRKARNELKEHVLEGNKLREEIDRAELTHKAALQQAVEQQKLMETQAKGAQQQLAVVREELDKMKADFSRVQDNYERELQLHAEEVSKASASRKLVEEERKLRVEKEQQVVALEAKVQSLEKETQTQLDVLQKRLEDAADAKSAILEQNKLLHSQLERAAAQVRRTHEEMLKKAADKPSESSSADSTLDGANAAHDKEVDDLRSVIAFLRRESEIASSKLELAQQEAQRHRTQIFSLESTIDRLREEIKSLNSAATTSTSSTPVSSEPTNAEKRVAQLEQLSLLRESNATLRDENQKNLARLQQEEAKRKALEETLAPLQTSEAALKTLVDSLKQEIVTLNEANKRWKQRVEQLVEKYQQVDPAEHDAVVAERDTLKKEAADAAAKLLTLEAEVETLRSTSVKTLEEERTKSENWSTQYERIKGFAKSWKNKAEALSKQLGEKNKESEARASALSAQITALTSEKNALEAKLEASEASKQDSAAAASGASATWEKEKQELHVRLDAETKRATQLKDFNTRLMQGIKTLKKENSELKDQVQTHASVPTPTTIPAAAVVATTAPTATPAPSPPSASPPAAEAPKAQSEAPKQAPAAAAVPPAATAAPSVSTTTSIAPKVPVPAATPSPPAVAAPKTQAVQEIVTKSTTTVTSTSAAPTTTTSSATASTTGNSAAPVVESPAPPSNSVTPATAPVTSTMTTTISKPSPPLPPTPAPAAAPASASPPVAGSTSAAEPTAEEKLRMFALQSMRRIPAAGARAAGTPTKPVVAAAPSSSPPRPTPPPLQLEDKVSTIEIKLHLQSVS